MYDIASSLRGALDASADHLAHAAASVAHANTGAGAHALDTAMAETAQQAVFTEAVLSAMHARLSEIKQVAK